MSEAPLNKLDGDLIGGTTASGGGAVMPLDPDNNAPQRAAELIQTAGRGNTIDQHVYCHKFRIGSLLWQPTQLPGTILADYKNHPSIHPFINYLMKKYLYWAGSFSLTFTICGSGLLGGRLRFLRVPPHVTDEDIKNMTVNDLSFFDGVDLDPKSLMQITLPMEDINRLKMHRMTDSLDDVDAYGSRLLVIVYGQLQAQIGDNTGITVIVEVEVNPDFILSTMVPTQNEVPSFDYSILNFGGKRGITWQGKAIDSIKSVAGTTRVVKNGFCGLTKPGGDLYVPNDENSLLSVNVLASQVGQKTTTIVTLNEVQNCNGRRGGVWANWNVNVAQNNSGSWTSKTYAVTFSKGGVTNGFTYAPAENKTDLSAVVSDIESYIQCGISSQMEDEGFEFAPVNEERVLYFGVSYTQMDGKGMGKCDLYKVLQPSELSTKMAEIGANPSTAYIFSYHDAKSGEVIGYCKMYPNGIMTIPKGTDELSLPIDIEFKFLTTQLYTDLIPVETIAMRENQRIVSRAARRSRREV